MRSSDFPGLVDRLTTSFPSRKYARGGVVQPQDRDASEQARNESTNTFKADALNADNWWDRAEQNYNLTGILRDPMRYRRKYSTGGGVDGGADPDMGDSPTGSASDTYGGDLSGLGAGMDWGGISQDLNDVADYYGGMDPANEGGGSATGDIGSNGLESYGPSIGELMSATQQAPAPDLSGTLSPGYAFSDLMTSAMPAVTSKGFYDTPVGQAIEGLKERRADTTSYDMFNDPFNSVMSYPDMNRYAQDYISNVADRYGITPSQVGLEAIIGRSLAESPKFDLSNHANGSFGLASWRGDRAVDAREAINAGIARGLDPFSAQLDRLATEYFDPQVSREHGLGRNYDRGVQALTNDDPTQASKATLAFERPESPLPGNAFSWGLPTDVYGNKGYVDAYNSGVRASRQAANAGANAPDWTAPTAGSYTPTDFLEPISNRYVGASYPEIATPAGLGDLSSLEAAMNAGRPASPGMLDYQNPASPHVQGLLDYAPIDPAMLGGYNSLGRAVQTDVPTGLSHAYGLMPEGFAPTDFVGNTPAPGKAAEGPAAPRELIDGRNIMGPAMNVGIGMIPGVGPLATLGSYAITGQSPGYAVLDLVEKLTGEKGRAFNPNIAPSDYDTRNPYTGGTLGVAQPSTPSTPATPSTPSAPQYSGRTRHDPIDYERYGMGPMFSFFS